jgi:RNA polymerase sigma factor (sigma-70 family)
VQPKAPPQLRLVTDARYSDWEHIYQDNVGRIYRLMFAKVGNKADAEDLTAEVFLAVLGPLRILASVGEVRAYLLATARTVLAAHWRRTLGLEITTLDDEWLDPPVGPPDSTPTTATTRAAEEILSGLTPRYQQVLRLRFLDGLSVQETAAELGVSVANAKVLQHRALRHAAKRKES